VPNAIGGNWALMDYFYLFSLAFCTGSARENLSVLRSLSSMMFALRTWQHRGKALAKRNSLGCVPFTMVVAIAVLKLPNLELGRINRESAQENCVQ
jgi:hypothetical protein